MAIEFRCTGCNRLLRTGEGTAGKKAKCPECGAVVVIPESSTAAPSPGGRPAGPLPSQSPGESPFGPVPTPEASPGDSENAYQSAGAFGAAPVAYAQPEGGFSPQRIDFEDVFGRTWAIFKQQWGPCLLVMFVVFLINLAFRGPILVLQKVFEAELEILLVLHAADFVASLCLLWITIGQWLYFLKIARGQPAELSELFTGGPYYLRILGATILFSLIVMGGYLLCIVPGIIFGLMFSQFYYLILDRNTGVIDSLSISKEIMVGNKLTLFLIGLVAGVAGVLLVLVTCGLGILAVAPFMGLLAPVIYLTMTGQPTADRIMTQETDRFVQ